MKKHALLIGCSGSGTGFLPGVERDVANFKAFLTSAVGGDWYESEITSLYNSSVANIKNKVSELKREKHEFVFLVFSGHGEYSEVYGCRRLYVTNEEYIYENDLLELSDKQITIIDTCAGTDDDILLESMQKRAGLEAFSSRRKNYRALYEKSISSCLPQEIILYACDIDEYSSDTTKGGLYASNLIKTANDNSSEEVLSALQAHAITSEMVTLRSRRKQNPQYVCSVKFGPKLPFSVCE